MKVLDHNGKGYLSNLLYGLHWIHDNHIRLNIGLVNMSLGFSEGSPPLYSMIEKLHDLGIIMVAAAGNKCPTSGGQEESGGDEGQGVCKDPQTTIMYPAAYSEVLSVAASDSKDKITYYSLEGKVGDIDITASGGARQNDKLILSTYLDGSYGFASGTSQSAALVTGILALKLRQQPALSLDDVRTLLQHTATPIDAAKRTQEGWGLIDAESLLNK